MKRLVAVFLLAASPFLWGQYAMESISNRLDIYAPLGIEASDGVLSITMNEQRITNDIYISVITTLCLNAITDPPSLNDINEVRVLNMFGRQGFVFEGGRQECEGVVNFSGNNLEIHILGMTHAHMN